MAVLKDDTANPRREPEVVTVRRRPVWHGQPSVLAGHQGARDDDDQSGASDEYGDSMMPACERRGRRRRPKRQAPSSERVILSANQRVPGPPPPNPTHNFFLSQPHSRNTPPN